jgi:hypothetical protein
MDPPNMSIAKRYMSFAFDLYPKPALRRESGYAKNSPLLCLG